MEFRLVALYSDAVVEGITEVRATDWVEVEVPFDNALAGDEVGTEDAAWGSEERAVSCLEEVGVAE